MKGSSKHVAWLYAQLPEWQRRGWVSGEAAEGMRELYGPAPAPLGARLALVIFAVLGSLLIVAGIILLFAFNWENLPRPLRAGLALLPLVLSQVAAWHALTRSVDSAAWREGSAGALSLAVAAALSLISQTYHLPGDLGQFLLTVALLTLPAVYLLRSSTAFVLYQVWILWWAGYAQSEEAQALGYWLLLACSLPHYTRILRDPAQAGTARSLTWCLALAITGALGIVLEKTVPGVWILVYAGWFSLLFLADVSSAGLWRERPLGFLGGWGIAILGLVLTYEEPWRNIGWDHYRTGWQHQAWATAGDWLVLGAVTLGATVLWVRQWRAREITQVLWGSAFLWAMAGFLLAVLAEGAGWARLLFNLFLFALSLATLLRGLRRAEMGTVNRGLVLLSVLLLMRFFDQDWDLVARGLAFILIGAGFLTANLFIARRLRGMRQP